MFYEEEFSKDYTFKVARRTYLKAGSLPYYATRKAYAFLAQVCLIEGVPSSNYLKGYVSKKNIKKVAFERLEEKYAKYLMSYFK